MDYRFAKRFDGITGSAIRAIFALLADPNIISFAGGNPSPQTFPKEDSSVDPIKSKPEEDISAHFAACVWLGEKCSELSEMAATAQFPLDVDGLAATEEWLREQYKLLMENA